LCGKTRGAPAPSADQMRAVLSAVPVATRWPSGLKATDITGLSCSRTIGAAALSALQIRAVPSTEAVAIRLLFGLHAEKRTAPVWPLSETGAPASDAHTSPE